MTYPSHGIKLPEFCILSYPDFSSYSVYFAQYGGGADSVSHSFKGFTNYFCSNILGPRFQVHQIKYFSLL